VALVSVSRHHWGSGWAARGFFMVRQAAGENSPKWAGFFETK